MSKRQDLYMSKKKNVSMAMNLVVNMTLENEEFLQKWEKDEKEQKRVSLMKEAFDFINIKAFEDFGVTQSSFSKEVSKLILIAKDCLEEESKE